MIERTSTRQVGQTMLLGDEGMWRQCAFDLRWHPQFRNVEVVPSIGNLLTQRMYGEGRYGVTDVGGWRVWREHMSKWTSHQRHVDRDIPAYTRLQDDMTARKIVEVIEE